MKGSSVGELIAGGNMTHSWEFVYGDELEYLEHIIQTKQKLNANNF